MRIVTSDQMKNIENRSEELGVSKAQLMENAGTVLADIVAEYCVTEFEEPTQEITVVLLAGSGNNGGDCFVAARKLSEKGYDVTVVNLCGMPHTDIAKDAFRRMLGTHVRAIRAFRGQNMKSAMEAAELEFMTNPDATSLEQIQYDEKQRIDSVTEVLAKAKVIVDGVFGTGFHGRLDKEVAAFLNAETSAYKFAVDIPSGGNCKTGEICEGTFSADETIAFGAVKTGMTQYPLKSLCGKIRVADIGIPEKAYDVLKGERTYTIVDRNELENFPQKRKPDAHKGSFGKVLCITGSKKMRGASALSALGALRSGAGLVTVASVEKAVDAVSVLAPEATFCELESDDLGFMHYGVNKLLLREEIEKADAVLIGCGMGVTEDTAELTKFVIESAKCPVIVDADGINCIALDIDILLRKKTELILTPHPGEMARLLGCGASEINFDRLSVAGEFARLYGVNVVLKGAGTVVAGAKCTSVIETGNPGMSCGGSGDVLAGIIASLVAQGYSSYDAARFGAHIHGLAGDIAAERMGQEFMLPMDIIDALSDSIKKAK